MRQSDHPTAPKSTLPPAFEALLWHLSDIAAASTLPHFRQGTSVESKDNAGFDPVTEADRAGERAIRKALKDAFPDHGIIGEEYPDEAPNAEFVWVVDPIDGTRSFISGIPLWGTLIGLTEHGLPRLGLMAQPFTGEVYFGDGLSARYEGPGGPRTLTVRKCDAIADAVVFTTSPDLFSEEEEIAYRRVESHARLARYGTDCYAYCMVASGFVDAVIEAGLKPHDIVPLIPIIEGAGGMVTDWSGNLNPTEGRIVASGDRRLHEEILQRLAG